jgi:hypothetical protein
MKPKVDTAHAPVKFVITVIKNCQVPLTLDMCGRDTYFG